jgi:hypothetical protein
MRHDLVTGFDAITACCTAHDHPILFTACQRLWSAKGNSAHDKMIILFHVAATRLERMWFSSPVLCDTLFGSMRGQGHLE